MPRFSHVLAKVPCPRCGIELADGGAIGFQWGYCSNPLGGPYFTSELGEPLLWRRAISGQVPAWAYFREWGLFFGGGANIGDPAFGDLLVRESEFQIRSCHGCGHPIEGIAVRIKRGLIAAVEVYEVPGSLPDCDVATLEDDGSYRPRAEWNSHPMVKDVKGGWICRLIEMPELLPSGRKE